MKNLRMVKKLGSLALMLAMVITMSVTALPVYAAAGGTINITYNPNIDGLDQMEFKLYKVAHFDSSSGEAQIVYDAAFADCESSVPISILNSIKKPASEEERVPGSEWNQNWLDAAKGIDDWAKGKGKTPVKTVSLEDKADAQPVSVTENGIYLLTAAGNEQRVGDQYWAPVPVLIMVLNGDTAFTITDVDLKMVTRAVVYKHTVTKVWQDTGYESGRPKSVKVGIIYGDTQLDTVELSDVDDNNWTYTWYSQEAVYDTGKTKLDRLYSSKNLETGEGGVVTEKLNEGNDFTLDLGDLTGTWSVSELDNTGSKTSADNSYIWSVSGPVQTETDDSESFKITNIMLTPVKHNPPVLKKVTGDDADPDDTFEFKFEAVSNSAGLTDMPMPEGSKDGVKVIKTKADVLREFGDIEFKTPGSYYYKISEVNTGLDGYTYDTSVYTLHYTITTNDAGTDLVCFLETTKDGQPYGQPEYVFENEYEEEVPPPDEPNTGDYTNIVLPVAVFVGAMIVFVVMLLKRRQRKDSK